MFSLSTVATNFESTQKKFKKFGKKLRKQRDGEVDSIKEKIFDVFRGYVCVLNVHNTNAKMEYFCKQTTFIVFKRSALV